MNCPKCNTQIFQKYYSPGQLIFGDFQLIGVAGVPLIVLSCLRCLSFRSFKQDEQYKIALYLNKASES